jgi:hypothetical protein
MKILKEGEETEDGKISNHTHQEGSKSQEKILKRESANN